MSTSRYEVRVAGAVGDAAREAFAGLAVDIEPTCTVLSGDLDQAALHGLLDRIQALGLELVDVKRAGRDRGGGRRGGPSPGSP